MTIIERGDGTLVLPIHNDPVRKQVTGYRKYTLGVDLGRSDPTALVLIRDQQVPEWGKYDQQLGLRERAITWTDYLTLTRKHGLERPKGKLDSASRKEIRRHLSDCTEQYCIVWDRDGSPQKCTDEAMSRWFILEGEKAECKIESQWDEDQFKYVAFYNGVQTDKLREFEEQAGETATDYPRVGDLGLGVFLELPQEVDRYRRSQLGHDPPH